MASPLPASLDAFLVAQAESLDADGAHADAVVPVLGTAGILREGVPVALGGHGSPTSAAVRAIAAVAERSLAAAFVTWGQRAFVEYLLQSPNAELRERWLEPLLAGRHAGATGLSNAMKFLSGIESLGLVATPMAGGGFIVDGTVPWATNLRGAGFVVAVAVARADGRPPFVAALPSGRPGLTRSADLDLIALRGSATASLAVRALPLQAGDLLTDDARAWLPRVRPAFLSLQCGLSIGLARAALDAARGRLGAAKAVLGASLDALESELAGATAALLAGVDDGRFVAAPVPLFELRIALAGIALRAVQLELGASGGRAYHRDVPLGFARRWREAAFLPIVTPSLAQLQGELLKHRSREASAA